MGRSENSRSRVYTADGGRVFTEASNPAKLKDPSLVIYNAMAEVDGGGAFIVSNGDQTDTILKYAKQGSEHVLCEILQIRTYEPDGPNFTPRITGVTMLWEGIDYLEFSILRKTMLIVPDSSNGDCERCYYRYNNMQPGFGACITTYEGDGDPLPSFGGGPYVVPLPGDIDEVANLYWGTLNEDNRVSIAVKFIDLSTGSATIKIINKEEKVE